LTQRAPLLNRFTVGLARPLTLVSAPAGFGKSTLLSAWIDEWMKAETGQKNRGESGTSFHPPAFTLHPSRISWLSLEPADNQAARFWTYVVAAIQAGLQNRRADSASPGVSPPSLSLNHLLDFLQTDPPPAIQPVLDELINTITGQAGSFLLVLDDYHEIQTPQIHEQMTYLLDHQPPNLHLVISTRADPPLPISRLRARGQLSEFRAADLRFTPAEAADYLKATIGLEFPWEDVAAIQASTEGWIAGLQMAALALQAQFSGPGSTQQAQEQAHRFIRSFSGKHTYILDYLADEVFNHQPEPVQAFLLKTSVLDRFCRELCDYILGAPGKETGSPVGERRPGFVSPAGLGPSAEILSTLEKKNLFLIPLDAERQWFRYHHLFADLLRVRLNQAGPKLKFELFKHASAWYAQNGSMEEAIQYAVMAQDWERAAELMEREIQAFLERGQLSRVMDWVALLPVEVSAQRIWLLFQQAYVLGLAHRMKEFMPLLAAEEQALEGLERNQTVSREEINRLRCNLCFHQGYFAIVKNDPQQAMQLALEGIRILPPDAPWEESWLFWLRAYASRSLNRLGEAVEGFQEAFQAAQKHGNLWNDMVCLTDLAMVYHLLGDLKKACDLYFKALELGKQRGAAGHSYLNRVEGWLSLVLIERNEVEAAGEHARSGLELSQYWPSTNARSTSFIALAQVAMVKGNLGEAENWLELAEKERQKSPLMPVNHSLLDYNRVRFWLARGDLAAASQWAQPFRQNWRDRAQNLIVSESLEVQWLALARILIALGRSGGETELAEAVDLLARIESSARGSGRVNSLVEVGVLKAVAMQSISMRRKNTRHAEPAALHALEDALGAGEPGGYLRIFVNEGPLILDLLNTLHVQYRSAHTPAYSQPYLDAVIAAFPFNEALPSKKPEFDLPEPLTVREMEVLRLIASGLSNKEAAAKLVLSEGTIKTHIHNLMGKLDAQSRTQAIARARELNLI
jgi:LuxR family maltose regulon positive regulatory protein